MSDGDGPQGATVELVLFSLGKRLFAAPRADVRAIRPSRRLRGAGGPDLAGTVLSLSTLLGLDRDTSVDRRVLEVEYWGERVGLEVTALAGIRHVPVAGLHSLPSLVTRCSASQAVVGVMETDAGTAVLLDLGLLLAERGMAALPG